MFYTRRVLVENLFFQLIFVKLEQGLLFYRVALVRRKNSHNFVYQTAHHQFPNLASEDANRSRQLNEKRFLVFGLLRCKNLKLYKFRSFQGVQNFAWLFRKDM